MKTTFSFYPCAIYAKAGWGASVIPDTPDECQFMMIIAEISTKFNHHNVTNLSFLEKNVSQIGYYCTNPPKIR